MKTKNTSNICELTHRNERLLHFLAMMGHTVFPILDEEDNIKYLTVTTAHELSSQLISEMSASTRVLSPIKRTQIKDFISSSESLGENVVKFPTKF